MNLDTTAISDLTTPWTPRNYLRVTPLAHAATPLGMGFGQTRFASPSKAFRVLYIAKTLRAAVAETIVRDRFVARARRRLTEDEIDDWGVTLVAASNPLQMLDLRSTGCLELGIPTDVIGAKSHRQGRRFSEALYAAAPAIDGILYPSRLTKDICVAVYDRAVSKLSAGPVLPLIAQPNLIAVLTGLKIQTV